MTREKKTRADPDVCSNGLDNTTKTVIVQAADMQMERWNKTDLDTFGVRC